MDEAVKRWIAQVLPPIGEIGAVDGRFLRLCRGPRVQPCWFVYKNMEPAHLAARSSLAQLDIRGAKHPESSRKT